jgi:putative transposase
MTSATTGTATTGTATTGTATRGTATTGTATGATVEEAMVAAVKAAVVELAPLVGVRAACAAVGRSRARHYRHHRVGPPPPPRPRASRVRSRGRCRRASGRRCARCSTPSGSSTPPRPRCTPRCSTRAGTCAASPRCTGSCAATARSVSSAAARPAHPPRVRPELVATGPNQCWSWDITRLAGPAKWIYYHLYVIIDNYSRYVPGWLIAERESAALAERLLAETIAKQRIDRDQLTIHADRGTSMASKPVAVLLADLGVTKVAIAPALLPVNRPIWRIFNHNM